MKKKKHSFVSELQRDKLNMQIPLLLEHILGEAEISKYL